MASRRRASTQAGQHRVEAHRGLDAGAFEGASVHIGEEAGLGAPHVLRDCGRTTLLQRAPIGCVARPPHPPGERGERAKELMGIDRHVDALEAQARLPPAHVRLPVHRQVPRHVLLSGLEVVHDGEHSRALGVARTVQPAGVAGQAVVAAGEDGGFGVHLVHREQRVAPVGVVEVGAFKVVRVEPSVQRPVLLLVVEEVEERSPRFAPARRAPAHLHHVALRAVGDRHVEILDPFRNAGMAHVAPATLDAVEAQPRGRGSRSSGPGGGRRRRRRGSRRRKTPRWCGRPGRPPLAKVARTAAGRGACGGTRAPGRGRESGKRPQSRSSRCRPVRAARGRGPCLRCHRSPLPRTETMPIPGTRGPPRGGSGTRRGHGTRGSPFRPTDPARPGRRDAEPTARPRRSAAPRTPPRKPPRKPMPPAGP